MRLGIMQPYFFPYLGHFSLIAAADEWVVFDISQYTPKSWMSRNRILHPKESWQYVSVPLSNASISIRTHEARVLDLAATHQSILGKLSHYKGKAPYYRKVAELVAASFDGVQGDSLVSLNVAGLRTVCAYLGIPFQSRLCSEMDLQFPDEMAAGDWAPHICRQLGASHYVNPASGEALFDPALFASFGVTLQLASPTEFKYATGPYHYEPYLSILDVLMWNAPDLVSRAAHDNVQIRNAA